MRFDNGSFDFIICCSGIALCLFAGCPEELSPEFVDGLVEVGNGAFQLLDQTVKVTYGCLAIIKLGVKHGYQFFLETDLFISAVSHL
jgi:hypothetical protein